MNANDLSQQWADRSGEYSPAYYAHYGPDETSELVRTMLDGSVAPDARVLELGCSSGRHLSHLHDHGYRNLAGVEVNGDAFNVMADTYPDLFADGTFYEDAIEDVLGTFDDGAFDAVYSVETLQHLHPDLKWVFDEIGRITDDVVLTAEIENPVGGDATGDVDERERDSDERERDSDERERDPDVNHVDDGLPLYYRDWNDVFSERGFEERAVRSTRRDTVRLFRLPAE